MRKKMTIPLTAILLVGLVLGVVTSAHGVRRHVVVGSFEAGFSPDNRLYSRIWIYGSGNITQVPLSVSNSVPDAKPGDDQAAALAFASLAQSLGCTVGGLGPGSVMPESISVSFLCEGLRDELISVIGELMKFSLTLRLSR
jgi:hypothetical protein